MGRLLEGCVQANSGAGTPRWAGAESLNAADVTGPAELPFWLPDPGTWGLFQVTRAKAGACGLVHLPLPGTVVDTLASAQARPNDHKWTVGLDAGGEADILKGLE